MIAISLFLMFAAHISVCSDSYCPLVTPSEIPDLSAWAQSINRNSTLEVKFITSDPHNNCEVQAFGNVFTVRDCYFWQTFDQVARQSIQNYDPVYNGNFNNSVKETLLQAPCVDIEGVSPLSKDHIKRFFPNGQEIAWRVGHTSCRLFNIPGTIMLCPGGGAYALHFIPSTCEEMSIIRGGSIQQSQAAATSTSLVPLNSKTLRKTK